MEDFAEVVQKAWDVDCPEANPVSVWQYKIRNLRRKVKGWSRNRDSEMRKCKQDIILELDNLDALTEVEAARRKDLSIKLDKFWKIEETKAW
jgi:hypothetical protein